MGGSPCRYGKPYALVERHRNNAARSRTRMSMGQFRSLSPQALPCTHMGFAHQQFHIVSQAISKRACAYCGSYSSSHASAVEHTTRSITKAECITDLSVLGTLARNEDCESGPFTCRVCSDSFLHPYAHRLHILPRIDCWILSSNDGKRGAQTIGQVPLQSNRAERDQ